MWATPLLRESATEHTIADCSQRAVLRKRRHTEGTGNGSGLLKDARILILDEPTSALDPETEAYLVDALHEAAKDKLVIIIAHRLSTIAHADKIFFLEDGEIREEGSHEELMAKPDGHYRGYVTLQAGAQ